MVLGYGLRLTLAGLGCGLIVALVSAQLMRGLLFGVKPTDPATFVATALLLGGTALLASYLPALKATRVDPMIALREE
jgi:putative ABC transport system permease protein